MNQTSKLSVAMELVEKRIAECSIKLHETKENKELNKKYQELLRIRDKIYKNDEKEIEAIIIEERKQKND